MSAITLINLALLTAEFRIGQDRIGVHSNGEAVYPTSTGTAQQWTIYAIVKGITTNTVETEDPNATINLVPDNNDNGYSVAVSS